MYDTKQMLMLHSYTMMDEDAQASVRDSLTLPDDVLSDILGDETPDDINKLKEALGQTDGN